MTSQEVLKGKKLETRSCRKWSWRDVWTRASRLFWGVQTFAIWVPHELSERNVTQHLHYRCVTLHLYYQPLHPGETWIQGRFLVTEPGSDRCLDMLAKTSTSGDVHLWSVIFFFFYRKLFCKDVCMVTDYSIHSAQHLAFIIKKIIIKPNISSVTTKWLALAMKHESWSD